MELWIVKPNLVKFLVSELLKSFKSLE